MEGFDVGEWRITPVLNRIERGGDIRHLEPRAMDLLVHLACHPGRVLTKEQLIEAVWPEAYVTDGALTYAIAQLRQQLGDDARQPRYVETIARRGYRLVAQVQMGSPSGFRSSDGSEPSRSRLFSSVPASSPTPTSGGRAVLRLLQPLVHEDRQEVDERCPYPGLAPFTERDTSLFYGREQEIAAIWRIIPNRPLLAVIGPSGSGKTSFLRAGVIPARPAGWKAAYAVPGAHPAAALARSLTPDLAAEPETMAELLSGVAEMTESGDCPSFLNAVRRWKTETGKALIVIDQFEELFTLNPPATQVRMAHLIEGLSRDADVHVVLSIRDDFLIRCCEHPPLRSILQELTPLLPPGKAALRRALEEPARQLGYEFEDGLLVEEILAALDGVRGALPLLAFAVYQLWARRDRHARRLNRAAFREIGGVEGALAQHAESTLEQLGQEQKPLVRELFRNLVTGQGTRAAIDRDELLSVFADRPAAEMVLDRLVDARLLTTYEVAGGKGEPTRHRVEVIHESLLRAWPRLVRWEAQDQEGAVLRDQLRQAAHLWAEKGRSRDLLWTGTAYREFALWSERYPGALSAVEEDFTRAMRDLAGRTRRLWRVALAVGFGLLVLVLGVIGYLLEEAVEEESRAHASKLVALGRLELDSYPAASLAYARKSLETADTIEGRLLALESLWKGGATRLVPVADGGGTRLAFSPDGSRLAISGFSGAVVVYAEDGSRISRIENLPSVAYPRGVAFASGGFRLLTFVPRDPLLRIFGLDGEPAGTLQLEAESVRIEPDGRLTATGPGPSGPGERWVSVLDAGAHEPRVVGRWQPDWDIGTEQPGSRAPAVADPGLNWLVYGRDRRVFLHPLTTPAGDRDILLGSHEAAVRALVIHPDGNRLVSADEGGSFQLWSLADRRLLGSNRGPPIGRYSALSFDASGSRLAWSSAAGRASCIWEIEGPSSIVCYQRDPGTFGETAFHPAGAWLAAADFGRLVLHLTATPRNRHLGRHLEGPIMDLAFSPDSRLLASCARDGLRLWPLGPDAGEARLVRLPRDYFAYGAAWTPSAKEVVVSAPVIGVYRVPVVGGPARLILPYPDQTMALSRLAVRRDGRMVAIASHYAAEATDLRLFLVDLDSTQVRSLPLRNSEDSNPWQGGIRTVLFDPEGRVVFAGDGGVRRWDPETDTVELLLGGPGTFAGAAMDPAGRRIVANVGSAFEEFVHLRDSSVQVLDLETGNQRTIHTHGSHLTLAVALDPAGERVVTGDLSGVVRVGSIEGGEPQLYLGHAGAVTAVAVSPDGRWVASASGAEIWLWPMPDIAAPPFHTLSHEAIMAKLRSLTNLEVVPEPSQVTGYSLGVGPFPGWKDVPEW